MDCHVKEAAAGQGDTTALAISYVWRAMSKTDIRPAVKEPSGLLRTDGKRPDGVTLIHWKNGRCVARDDTVTDTMAQSYLLVTSHSQTSDAAAKGRQPSMPHRRRHIRSWRLQLKPWEP